MKIAVDSGAHSLFKKYTKKDNQSQFDFSYYETDEFWAYVDNYCAWLHENKDKIDLYVNLDVISNAELTWKVQKYMESKNLNPLPVYHTGEDISWLKKYIENYEYFAIGGLGQQMTKSRWLMNSGDIVFDLVCDSKGMPRNKVHGFAMTSPDLIVEFPFFSIDSTSWMQFGKYGIIITPKKKNNHFVYDESPHIISVSARKKSRMKAENFVHLSPEVQKQVHEYLESIGLKMGKSILEHVNFDQTRGEFPISKTEVSDQEKVIEKGVCNNATMRDQANLSYYLALEESIPPWPRPWKRKRKALLTKFLI